MSRYSGKDIFLLISFIFWLVVMGIIAHIHFVQKVDPELEYFAPDILFETGNRRYFSIIKDGRKIGYKSEALLYNPESLIYWEDSLIKLNLSGMSREVFMQCMVSVDSTRILSKHLDFTLQSGTHFYNCKCLLQSDSLIVDVKNNVQAPWRKGVFIVDENTTFPIALPYYMHRSEADTMNISVFDPVIFAPYSVNVVRRGNETLKIKDKQYDVIRYDLSMLDKKTSVWLDGEGKIVKSSGYLFFSGELGEMAIEKAADRDVFLLPLEVSLGSDIIKNTKIYPDKSIPDPRNIQYLEIQLDGIRAANIDIIASNKKFISADPVIFGIHNRPLFRQNKYIKALMLAENDTTIVGTSDYIQSTDARIRRAAESIVASETDTLYMARRINRWVFEKVTKESGLDIARSLDVFRELRGDCDEHTKLFTALARSIGIPTQINMGLVYENGAFQYHSWPSVLSDGVWHDMDPTFGQDRTDATHIALIRGDFDRMVEFFRVAGRISIKILDYR